MNLEVGCWRHWERVKTTTTTYAQATEERRTDYIREDKLLFPDQTKANAQ